jgi:hypothetical protein
VRRRTGSLPPNMSKPPSAEMYQGLQLSITPGPPLFGFPTNDRPDAKKVPAK